MLWVRSLMSFSGLWIPSKMEPMIPGPSSTERGFPVRSTGSPTDTPAGFTLSKIKNRCNCRTFFLMSPHGQKDTRLLVDLDGGHVPLQSNNLPHQLAVANADQLIHGRARHGRGRHHCENKGGTIRPSQAKKLQLSRS